MRTLIQLLQRTEQQLLLAAVVSQPPPPPRPTHRLAGAVDPNDCHPAAEACCHIHIRQLRLGGCGVCEADISQLGNGLLLAGDAVQQPWSGEPAASGGGGQKEQQLSTAYTAYTAM